MKNLKTTIITVLLLLAMAGGAVAQEKWEYATVTFCPPGLPTSRGLYVSISGKEFDKIEVRKEDAKSLIYDNTFCLNYIQKMTSEQGWRVISSSIHSTDALVFVLERKKN